LFSAADFRGVLAQVFAYFDFHGSAACDYFVVFDHV